MYVCVGTRHFSHGRGLIAGKNCWRRVAVVKFGVENVLSWQYVSSITLTLLVYYLIVLVVVRKLFFPMVILHLCLLLVEYHMGECWAHWYVTFQENKLPKSSRCKTKPHWPPPGDKTIRSIAEDYRDNSAVHSSELQGHSVHFDNFLRIIRDSAITLKLRQCQFRLLQFSVCKMLVNSSVCVLFSVTLCLQSVTFTILRAIVCHVTISFLFPVFHWCEFFLIYLKIYCKSYFSSP